MTQAELHQNIWKQYEREHNHMPAGTRVVTQWAVEKGLLPLPTIDPIDVLAGQMSRSLREEIEIDSKGRRHRVNHAVRIMKDGVQTTMWGISGFAAQSHMEMSFTQRREQIIGDCHQLKIDVDVYNESDPDREDFQLVLDFTDDVAERSLSLKMG